MISAGFGYQAVMEMTITEFFRYSRAVERNRKAELRELLLVSRAAQADQDGYAKVLDLLS